MEAPHERGEMRTSGASSSRRQQPRRDCKKRKKERISVASQSGASSEAKFGDRPPARRLPLEVLARVLTYIDVRDVPSVARCCGEWRAALRVAEGELWLALVRRHHPTVEEITDAVAIGRNGNDGEAPRDERGGMRADGATSPSSPTMRLPPPSLNWRTQFQRRHMFVKSADSGDERRTGASARPPRPLSSYIAQVDLTCRRYDGTKMGLVSTVAESLAFDGDSIEFRLRDLRPQLSAIKFARFDLAIHLIDRSSGRQTPLYVGSPEEWVEEAVYAYEDFHGFDLVPVLRALSPEVGSYVSLQRTGCACECEGGLFFAPTEFECQCGSCGGSCDCCGCEEKWSCFHRYRISLRLIRDIEQFDFEDMDREECLRFLQDGLVFS